MAEDSFSRVARSLAESVSPDEEELAPFIVRAYAEGTLTVHEGTSGAVLGGFIGGAESGLFLNLIDCLAACSGILSSAFALRIHRLELRSRKAEKGPEAKAGSDELEEGISAVARLLVRRGVPAQQASEVSRRAIVTLVAQGSDGRSFVERLAETK